MSGSSGIDGDPKVRGVTARFISRIMKRGRDSDTISDIVKPAKSTVVTINETEFFKYKVFHGYSPVVRYKGVFLKMFHCLPVPTIFACVTPLTHPPLIIPGSSW